MSNAVLFIGGFVFIGGVIYLVSSKTKGNKTNVKPKSCDMEGDNTTVHQSFNLIYLKDLSSEYKVELNSLDDFRYLLERIEVINQVRITKIFKEKSDSAEKLVHLWDTYQVPSFTLRTSATNKGGRNISEDDINLICESKGLTTTDKSIERKIEELINASYQKGYSNFKRLFGDKIERLKNQYLTNTINHYLLESIQEDFTQFLKFIS